MIIPLWDHKIPIYFWGDQNPMNHLSESVLRPKTFLKIKKNIADITWNQTFFPTTNKLLHLFSQPTENRVSGLYAIHNFWLCSFLWPTTATCIDGCRSIGRKNCSLVTPVNRQWQSDGYLWRLFRCCKDIVKME